MGVFGSGDKKSESTDARQGVSDQGTLLSSAAFQFIGSSSAKKETDYTGALYVAIAVVGILWLVNIFLRKHG